MSFSSSIEYWASSTLRWLSASRLAGCCCTRKLRNGSRLRSLSTKSFSVYSGPLSSGGRAAALAEAAARLGGGGTEVVVGVPHPPQRASADDSNAAVMIAATLVLIWSLPEAAP